MAEEIDLGIAGIGPATLLDRGGSAFVYLAEQEDFGRKVAVKVLFDALEDDATYKRFDRECRAIGAVSHHPNIVVVHGRGLTQDERPYLIMEYRSGGSLASRLALRGRLTEAEAISIGVKIGGALQVGHEAGVLHRDVKPANILLSSYNEPALADFGIARVEGGHKTTEGVFSASVVHASREVLDSGEPTPRSDVYGLASTMFEMVTGAAAYADPEDRSMWAVINRVLSEDPPDPTTRGVSDGLAATLRKAMSHEVDERHASAAEFVAELQTLNSPTANNADTEIVDLVPEVAPNEPAVTSKALSKATRRGVLGRLKPSRLKPTRLKPSRKPKEPQRDGALSRAAVGAAVAVIAVGTTGIGVFSAIRTAGDSSDASAAEVPATDSDISGTTTGISSSEVPQSIVNPVPATDQEDGRSNRQDGSDEPDSEEAEQPPVTTGPFTPELAFPRAAIGPLQVNERYVLTVTNAPAEAEYRIVVDRRPVTQREPDVPIYFPKPGRHQLQVEVATDDRVELTAPVEIYVSDRGPEPGWRVYLSAVRSRPENWPEALRQFDQFVLDGHDQLQLSLSSREEGSALPYWNYYIQYGEDKDAAAAYCTDRDLTNDDCYIAEQ